MDSARGPSWCDYCHEEFVAFCRCQSTVILKALAEGKAEVPMGRVYQREMDMMRDRLQAATTNRAVNPEFVPLEILTMPIGPFGHVGFLVRRFVQHLGTCAVHEDLHPQYTNCWGWVKA
jgi:hypothetical protein